MRVTFVRTAGARDRIYVARDDGTELAWDFASYGEGLPHDLVHLVVESRFAITRGVWGRVAAGADLGRINALANRRGGKDKYAELGSEPEQLLLAEAVANAPWLRADDAEVLAAIHVALKPIGAVRDTITLASIASVQAELASLRDRWRGLGDRGALAFDYPLPAQPQRDLKT